MNREWMLLFIALFYFVKIIAGLAFLAFQVFWYLLTESMSYIDGILKFIADRSRRK